MFWCCCTAKEHEVKTIHNDEYEPAPGGTAEEAVSLRHESEAAPIPGDPAAVKAARGCNQANAAIAAKLKGDAFLVSLERAVSTDSDFGVSLFYSDVVDYLEIIDVDTTIDCVAAHNRAADKGRQLQAGQLILAVNGVTETKKMLNEWKGNFEVSCVVCWPNEFDISIEKVSGGMGVDVTHSKKGTALLIEGVHAGPVESWNQANPDQRVEVADRIVAVNGVRGSPADLKGALKASTGKIAMVIARRP